MKGQIKTTNEMKRFVMAGNAIITIKNSETQGRFTYRIRQSEGDGSVRFFVSVLTGPDNNNSYSYLGHIYRDDRYIHGRKSRIGQDALSEKAWSWFWIKLLNDNIPSQIEVWHEGRCGRCGRRLTVPESVENGIGPVCAGMMH